MNSTEIPEVDVIGSLDLFMGPVNPNPGIFWKFHNGVTRV